MNTYVIALFLVNASALKLKSRSKQDGCPPSAYKDGAECKCDEGCWMGPDDEGCWCDDPTEHWEANDEWKMKEEAGAALMMDMPAGSSEDHWKALEAGATAVEMEQMVEMEHAVWDCATDPEGCAADAMSHDWPMDSAGSFVAGANDYWHDEKEGSWDSGAMATEWMDKEPEKFEEMVDTIADECHWCMEFPEDCAHYWPEDDLDWGAVDDFYDWELTDTTWENDCWWDYELDMEFCDDYAWDEFKWEDYDWTDDSWDVPEWETDWYDDGWVEDWDFSDDYWETDLWEDDWMKTEMDDWSNWDDWGTDWDVTDWSDPWEGSWETGVDDWDSWGWYA